MSVKEIKAMGERLASHLASKHGVKLKHTAILEAMSVQFGFKDWNTFRTVLDGNVASSAGPASSRPRFRSPQGSYLMGFVGDEPYELSYDEMRRNLLICGALGSGISTAHHTLWSQHIRKGGGVIFLDIGRDLYAKEHLAREFNISGRAKDFHVLDFDNPEKSCRFNPLTGTPGEIARIAMAGFSWDESEDETWRRAAQEVVQTLAGALQSAHRPVTFPALLQLVQDPTARAELSDSFPDGHEMIAHLGELEQRVHSMARTMASILMVAVTSLTRFVHNAADAIFERGTGSLSIRDVIEKKQGLYINFSMTGRGLVFQSLARMFITQILAAIETTQRTATDEESPPFLVFLDSPAAYWTREMEALFARAPASDVGIVATSTDLNLKSRWTQTLVAQTWCKLFLRQSTLDGAEIASGYIGDEYRVRSNGSSDAIPRAPASSFLRFDAGEGWCLKGPNSAKIQVAIQENAA